MAKSLIQQTFCKFAGHQWGEWSIDKRKCFAVRKCRRCDEKEKRDLDHAWRDWVRVDRACQEKRVCGHCGLEESRHISHEWTEWKVVTKYCLQERHCVRCLKKEQETIEHSWGAWQTDGCQKIRTCLRCSRSERQMTGVNHRWVETFEEKQEYNTYEAEYRTVRKSRCAVCGQEEWHFTRN